MEQRRPRRGLSRRAFLYGGSAAAIAGGLAAGYFVTAGSTPALGVITTDAIGDQVQRLPRGQLPQFAGTADLQRLYRYAVAHEDELQYIPCFCGCHRLGHKNNHDCYVTSPSADGTVTFTSHAAT